MFSQDYLLRMLRQAATVLAEILRRKAAGQFKEAEASIAGALEGLTGPSYDLIARLEDESLLEHLRKPDGELDLDRLLVTADLTFESGEIYASQGRQAESSAAYLRALKFYLEVGLSVGSGVISFALLPLKEEEGEVQEATLLEEGLETKIEKAAGKLVLSSLPPELLFNLYLFYEQSENYERAETTLDQLVEILPNDETILQEREDFLRRRRGLDEA